MCKGDKLSFCQNVREKAMLLNVLNVKSENKVAQNEPAEFYRRPAATFGPPSRRL